MDKVKVTVEPSKPKRLKASAEQLAFLAEYMRYHPEVATGNCGTGLERRVRLEKLWLDLSKRLNSLRGPSKTVNKWKQAWRDFRNNVKKKAEHRRSYEPIITSAMEEQVITIMGPVVINEMEVPVTEPTPGSSQDHHKPSSSDATKSQDGKANMSDSANELSSDSSTSSSSSAAPSSSHPPPRKKSADKRLGTFHRRLLKIEEEKLKAKRQRTAVLARIGDEKVAAINRLTDVLQEIFNK